MTGATPARRRSGNGWILAGLLVLLLPVVLTLWNDHRIDQVTREYARASRSVEPPARARQAIEQAHRYNQRLAASGHHAMPATTGAPGLEDYLHQLDLPELQGVIGRVTIPRIGVDLPVRHTTNPTVLYHGAGHMFGSDLPVGGPGTTSVLSAHTGMVNATMFDNLPRLRPGDDIFLDVLGQTMRYQVRDSRVVGPKDASAIHYRRGVDQLVLVTCTPYGINTDRLLVESVRVPWDGGPVESRWRPHLSWWMTLDLLLVAVVLLWLAWRRLRERRRSQDAPQPGHDAARRRPAAGEPRDAAGEPRDGVSGRARSPR